MRIDGSVKPTKDATLRWQVLRNTISNYFGKIVTLGVWFFLTPFLLRQLGVDAYGLWILITSVVAYGSLLDFGVANAVTKYVAQYHAEGRIEQARSLVATALWLYLGLGLLAIVLGALLAPVLPKLLGLPPDQHATASWLTLLSALGLSVSLPSATTIAVLRGLHRFDLANVVGIIGMTLFTGATIAALLLGGGLLGMVAVNVPVTLITQLPAIWLVNHAAPELHFGLRGASRSLLKTVTSFSSTLFVINAASQLQTKTDEIVIGISLPIADVTPYSIARRLSELPQLLTEQFMKVLMPLASQLQAEHDDRRLRALYLTSTRLTLAVFLPLALGVVILAQPFIAVWVGAPYGQYAYLVLILTAASFMMTSQWPAGAILLGMGRHRILAVITLGSALVNLGLSLTLVHPFGLAGVALGTLIPATIENLGCVLPYAMRVNKVSLRLVLTEIYLPTLLPAVPMSAVLYGLRELFQPASYVSIAAIGGAGLLVYLLGYVLIGAGQTERQFGRDTLLAAIRFTRTHLGRARSDT
jgi:O-antigen/teichoic acid export membrane protein